jgi:hypothetical protein
MTPLRAAPAVEAAALVFFEAAARAAGVQTIHNDISAAQPRAVNRGHFVSFIIF